MGKIEELIEKKEKSLSGMYDKREALNKKLSHLNKEILTEEKNLKNLKNQKAAKQVEEINILLKEKGLSITDIINELKNGGIENNKVKDLIKNGDVDHE